MIDSGPLAAAVAGAIAAAKTSPQDAAAVELVRQYARILDDVCGSEAEAEVFADLGPKLLAGLTALGMTLAGRAKDSRGGDQGASSAANALAALRGERGAATRPRDAEGVDSSAS